MKRDKNFFVNAHSKIGDLKFSALKTFGNLVTFYKNDLIFLGGDILIFEDLLEDECVQMGCPIDWEKTQYNQALHEFYLIIFQLYILIRRFDDLHYVELSSSSREMVNSIIHMKKIQYGDDLGFFWFKSEKLECEFNIFDFLSQVIYDNFLEENAEEEYKSVYFGTRKDLQEIYPGILHQRDEMRELHSETEDEEE